MKRTDALRQMVIWPPALLGLMVLALPGWYLVSQAAPTWLMASYAVVGVVLVWWFAPRMGYQLWRDGDALCWRWGFLHHDIVRRLPLAEIAAVEVGSLPDQPTRPLRSVAGAEVHGGNFTPALNRGVKLTTQDGRMIWFGLPQPEKFADALRLAVAETRTVPQQAAAGQE
ncbi:hypothetical protein FNU76_09245 [Chitinimonas arctica]|uniref:PH domain-containing protein n=1 Tax=Chitinimonas arctica TaxID=2594795 RepID=A0A516SEE4_9NEIS|nr:hypothetical protein [Chitinimonas arctica]QDQ26539.1 hypothetical protein FNU76_09245 [Chitinimonas arctica]